LEDVWKRQQSGHPLTVNLAEVGMEYISTTITTEIRGDWIHFTLKGLRSNYTLETVRFVVSSDDATMYLSPP
jgi:hypothetical protein